MKILVVAATREEVAGVLESGERGAVSGVFGEEVWGSRPPEASSAFVSRRMSPTPRTPHSAPQYLITGVGMVATAYALGKHLATHQYDLAINLGIAGSFDRNIPLGTMVEVTEDTLTEMGAEDDHRFITLDALGFGQTKFMATAKLADYFVGEKLWQVTAATVNTVHGEEASIAKLHQRAAPQIESMEGAAFFYACRQAGVPAMQIRAVSNYVEKRNREAWKIGLAVKNLNIFAERLLRGLGSEV